MKKFKFYSFALAGLLVFNSCATNPVSGKREVAFISEEQEIAMGKEADPQIIAQFGLYQNPTLQNFIQQKGQQMVAVSHRKNLNYEFKIVDSPVLNAFAVPGGYVYFTRGIMAHFNSEAQFAGVLGHEIGHITARHTIQQQSKQILTQGVLLGGMIAFPELGQSGEAAMQGAGLLFLKFGRDAERQSDELGVEYATQIGYNAKYMADFFQTLQRQSDQARGEEAEIPSFLSTHPSPADRYTTVNQLAAQWAQKTSVPLQEGRNSYLKMIDGLIYGEDPKQGFVENNVFYHPELKFQFTVPANWNHQNSPQQFQMAPKDGKALMFLTLGQGATPEAAAQQFFQQMQLQVVESKSVTVNGLPALAVIGRPAPQQQQQGQQQQQQQQQQEIGTLSYFIKQGQTVYNITGVTAATTFSSFAPIFQNTMESFKPLTDPEKINRKPEVVRIKTVTQTGTLSQVLQSFNMPTKRLEELAILNGMLLTQQVEKGTLIKTVAK